MAVLEGNIPVIIRAGIGAPFWGVRVPLAKRNWRSTPSILMDLDSEDSVRNHVHRGMRKLRAELEAGTEGGSLS